MRDFWKHLRSAFFGDVPENELPSSTILDTYRSLCFHGRRQGRYYINGPGINSPVYVCDDCGENSLNYPFPAENIWEMP